MKKNVILALVALFGFNIAFSQTDEFVMTWGIVESEAKKSDADIANPKKAAKINTWMERGRKYLMVYTFDAGNIYMNTPVRNLPFIMNGGAKSQETIGDTLVYSYDRVKIYAKTPDSVVCRYERTGRAKDIFFAKSHVEALDVATAAYLEAKKMDADGKRSKAIGEQLKTIADYYMKEASFPYAAKDYGLAADYYTKAGKIVKTGYTEDTDENKIVTLKDCGNINKFISRYDQAIEFYESVISMAKTPTREMYGDIFYCQLMKKDTTSAINTLQKVLSDFPSDEGSVTYLNQLIDLYIQTKQWDNATTYLQKAIEAEPNNTAYLFNLGYLNATKGNEEAAIDYYKKAIEINPKDENSNLNLGVLYENKGRDILVEADKNFGKKNYNTLKSQGQGYLKQAYPYIETYASVTTDDFRKKNAYRDLMSIYMQLNMMDKYKAAKVIYDSL